MLRIEDNIESINLDDWIKFIDNHPNGNIFQSPEMYRVYSKTELYTPIVIFCFEDNNFVGVIQSVIQKENKGILGFFTSRCIIAGGPLAINNRTDIIDSLLKHHIQKVKGKVIYSQVRNTFDTSNIKQNFVSLGFKFESHLDIHINLNRDRDEYWMSLKSKLRQNIRKAEKEGVVLITASATNVNDIYSILEEVYKNAKIPIPHKSLFEASFKVLFPKGKLLPLIAVYKSKIIGCRLLLLHKDLVYDWFAGSLTEYKMLNPNDYLPYKAIEWGILNEGFNKFDFGGAGKPDVHYGVRDHKLKFCSELIDLGRYMYYHKPILYRLLVQAFKIKQKLMR